MTVMIVFATMEGQTGKIARFIEEHVNSAGHDVSVVDASDAMAELSFDGVETVFLAAPVHERRHPDAFEVLVKTSRDDLAKRRTMMVSVSLAAAFPELHEEAADYLTEMKMRVGFEPDAEMLVAGAVRPDGYGYFEQEVLRHVVLRGQDIDPGKGAEFTDWDSLAAGISGFLKTT